MSDRVPDSVQLRQACSYALAFLERSQLPSGEFRCLMSPDPQMARDCLPDSSPFPTALIVYCLSFSQDPVARSMIEKAVRFLKREKEWPGVWRYWTAGHSRHFGIPPDLDDTACVSYVLRQNGHRLRNRGILLANRNREGLFHTWVVPRRGLRLSVAYWCALLSTAMKPACREAFFSENEAAPDDVDGVVNANVLFYLGYSRRLRPVVDYLVRIVREGSEDRSDKWHTNPYTFHYAVSRLYARGVTALGTIRQEIVGRITRNMRVDGALGNELDTALALCSLINFGAPAPQLHRPVAHLLKVQRPGGEWPRAVLYHGGPQRVFGWGSEELTTGYCLEALERYLPAAESEGIHPPESREDRY